MNLNTAAAGKDLPRILVPEDSANFEQASEDDIVIFCQQLFDKCSRNRPTDKTANCPAEPCIYVACNDVIDYIINNKFLMEFQDNEECLQELKLLFCDTFNLTYSAEDNLFNGCQLDYVSMTNLIELWIHKIRVGQDNKRSIAPQTDQEDFDALDFSVAEFKALDAKIRTDTRMRSSNLYRSSKFEVDEEYFSQASSSKPSLSNSDDDNNRYSESFDNDFGQSRELLENRLHVVGSRNLELEGEIGQLKQTIADLRIQSRNAEDLNGQLVVEIEQKTQANTELRCRYNEVFARLMSSVDENETVQKVVISLRADLAGLAADNEYTKEKLRCSQAELKLLEEVNLDINLRNSETERIVKELQREKRAYIAQAEVNAHLEERLKELKEFLSEKEMEVCRLAQNLREKNLAIEALTENVENLTKKLDKANIKLFRNNVYGSSESAEKTDQRNDDELRCSLENLLDDVGTEDETVSSALLVSEYNENTFHVSTSSNDFRYEQFEHALTDVDADGGRLSEAERLCEHFKGFLVLAEELKTKVDKVSDSSFKNAMARFLEYGKSKQEMLEDLVNSNRRLMSRLDHTETRLRCSKYQLLAVMLCLFKFHSFNKPKPPMPTATKPSPANPIKVYNEPKKTTDWLAVSTRTPKSPITESFSVQSLNFDTFTTSILSPYSDLTQTPETKTPITSDDSSTSSANRTYENLNNTSREPSISHIMNSTEINNQQQLSNNVKIIDANSNCKYVKRMNSFSFVCDRGNKNIEDHFCKSVSFTNESDNEADIDEAYNKNSASKISGTKRYKNASRKFDSKQSGDFCRRCRTGLNLAVKGLNSSVSVPNLLDLADTYKTAKFNFILTKETSTQTSFEDETNCLASHSQLIMNDEYVHVISSSKKDHHLLKHQLTRDSGIDSDNTQQQQQRQFSLKPSQNSSNEENGNSLPNKLIFNSTVTCAKSSCKGPKSLTIKSIGPASGENKFSSSTRDNSIENDLESSSNEEIGELRDGLSVLFKQSVVDEDEEYAEDEYIEDKYIGEEYRSEKAESSNSSGGSGDEAVDTDEREFKEIRRLGKESKKAAQERMCLNSTMDESFGSSGCDPFEASRVKVDSPKPTIGSTSMSKLATKIKKKNLNSVSGLSIDQVLNLIDAKSPPSSSFTSTVASFWSKGRPDETTPGQHLPQLAKMRSIFKSSRANSISQSKSFDEYTSLTNRNLMEHRLKTLESNFNQVAMAYHTDEQVLNSCIAIYRDKYKKSSVYLNLLFEEISNSLGRMAVALLESEGESEACEDRNEIGSNLNECESEKLSWIGTRSSTGSKKSVGKGGAWSKKLLQEDLSLVNKELIKMKTKLLECITTSSMIAGLKQELHLTDLVKASITYVRELRRVQLLTNSVESEVTNTQGLRTPLIKRSNSITPQSFAHHLGANRLRSSSVQIEISSEPQVRKRSRWLQAMSTIKSLSSTISSPPADAGLADSVAALNDCSVAGMTILESEEALVPDLSFESAGHLEVGRSSITNNLDHINEENNDEIKIEPEDYSSIHNHFVGETSECMDDVCTQLNGRKADVCMQTTRNLWSRSSTAYKTMRSFCGVVKEQSQTALELLSKDAFLFVRKLMSMGILIATFVFCLMTVGAEIGERCVDFVLKKIEVRNYYEATRTT